MVTWTSVVRATLHALHVTCAPPSCCALPFAIIHQGWGQPSELQGVSSPEQEVPLRNVPSVSPARYGEWPSRCHSGCGLLRRVPSAASSDIGYACPPCFVMCTAGAQEDPGGGWVHSAVLQHRHHPGGHLQQEEPEEAGVGGAGGGGGRCRGPAARAGPGCRAGPHKHGCGHLRHGQAWAEVGHPPDPLLAGPGCSAQAALPLQVLV